MDYGCVKHIPLFIMVVLVFPSSLSFLHSFGPVRPVAAGHITSKALLRLDSARLKSFMDSSHAFYKVKHRYWPGLLFVLHFVFCFFQCLASISLNCGYVTFVIFCIKLFSLYIVEYMHLYLRSIAFVTLIGILVFQPANMTAWHQSIP